MSAEREVCKVYDELLNRYYRITEEIELEKNTYRDNLLLSIALSISSDKLETKTSNASNRNGDDSQKRFRQHELAMFSLRCLRIAIGSQMIYEDCCYKREQLRQDISDAVENVKNIEYKWKFDNTVVYDALEVMLAVCPDCKEIIKQEVKYEFLLNTEYNVAVTQDLYYLFNSTADYYEQNGKTEVAYSILEYLCSISRKRNSIKLHRELITRIIVRIGENAPDIICQIGNVDAGKFEGIIDKYAGNFFWFYACALIKMEDKASAEVYFKKCYNVRKIIYGENNWYTDVAKREYYHLLLYSTKGQKGQKFLFEFIDNIERGLYKKINENLLSIVEGKTIYSLLLFQDDICDFEKYNYYLKIYEEICAKYEDTDEPLLKVRLAKTLRGKYYLNIGDYIQAEKAFIDALAAELSEGIPEILTETQIKSDLLMIYCVQYDFDKAFPLLYELLDLIEDEKNTSGLSKKDKYRMYIFMLSLEMQAMIELEQEKIEGIKDILDDVCHDIYENAIDLFEYGREVVGFVSVAVLFFISNRYVSKEDLIFYMEVFSIIENKATFFAMNKIQSTYFYNVFALLAESLNHHNIEVYFKKAMKEAETNIIPASIKGSVFITSAIYYGKSGNHKDELLYIEKALSELTKAWQRCVQYLNDKRLISIITPLQVSFLCCYAMLRQDTSIEKSYEKLVQFKEIASLAGRERNRIIYNSQFDKNLLNQIQIIQNRIAAMETENIFRDISAEYEKEEKELRNLEAELARQFPQNIKFTDITLEKIKQAIPNGVAVVEYFLTTVCYGIGYFEPLPNCEEVMCMDIYILYKENNKCELNRVTIVNSNKILNLSNEFIEIFQAESSQSVTIEETYRKNDIRSFLYETLIKPIIPFINKAKTLYIAPDSDLLNLPFEILYGEDEERLEDNYNIIKIECARDVLFQHSEYSSAKGNLIIGNPKYKVDKNKLGKKGKEENNRAFNIRTDDIKQLPFSELEVQRIGKHSGSRYFSGFEASKNLFLSAKGYKNIHVATHGYFDLSDETESIYSSCLMFSGIKNWIETGEVSEVYGNGIVTADEVSRMDLHSVELVVLSSCLSGMNEIFDSKGFHGMIGALSAAGVHYVISHLWAANDFSTAVLMDEFYYQYIERNQSPSIALNIAKNHLRNITIGQLRQFGWFDYAKYDDFDEQCRELIGRYESWDDKIRPFKNETYWGGFACYRCN